MARLSGERGGAAPRLRFDKVARRVIQQLRESLEDAVPDGLTMVVTITAPILVPAKTASVLVETIRTGLTRRAPADVRETIHGNRVTVSYVRGAAARSSKVAGFVHNPETDPGALVELVRSGRQIETL